MFKLKEFFTRSPLRRMISSLQKMHDLKSLDESTQVLRNAVPKFINEITSLRDNELKLVEPWLRRILNYNFASAITVNMKGNNMLYMYNKLENPENINEININLAFKLALCVEMLESQTNVLDDIMDNSIKRNGKLCWYKLPDVGLGAINDAAIMFGLILRTLKLYFHQKHYYMELVHLFNECIFYACVGEYLDLHTKMDKFKMEHYNTICKLKTSLIGYVLPVRLCLYICGHMDESIHKEASDISNKIGILFQIQNDYLDVYGDESVTGKVGTDIQEGKCSWLAVKALQLCNDKQYDLMKQHYGSKDKQHIQQILDLYKELNVKQAYYDYEESAYNSIRNDINKLPNQLSHDLFYTLLDKICNRQS